MAPPEPANLALARSGAVATISVARRALVDAAARVVVLVDQRGQAFDVVRQQRLAALLSQRGELLHGLDDGGLAAVEAPAYVVVEALGRLAQVAVVGDVEARQPL